MAAGKQLLAKLTLAWLLALAGPAAAFEGVLELSVQIDGQASRAHARLRDGDVRIDAELEGARTSSIVLGSNAGVLCQVLHPTRSWERVPLTSAPPAPGRFLVEALPAATVLGRQVKGARLVDTKSGDAFDVWLDPTLGDARTVDRIWRALKRSDASLARVLAERGLVGFPVKLKLVRRHGGVVEVEAVRAEAQRLSDGVFEPPPGYRQVSTRGLRSGDVGAAVEDLKSLFGR